MPKKLELDQFFVVPKFFIVLHYLAFLFGDCKCNVLHDIYIWVKFFLSVFERESQKKTIEIEFDKRVMEVKVKKEELEMETVKSIVWAEMKKCK
jgi:hypothetical protein